MYDTLLSFGLMIVAGLLFRRLKVGGLDGAVLRQAINSLVLNIFLPALCVKVIYSSAIDSEVIFVPATAWITIGASLVMALGMYAILGRRMQIKPAEKGVLILSSAFGNFTYLGIPVLTGLYGYSAAKYALFYDLLAGTPLLWIIGALVASRYGEETKFDLWNSIKTVAALPPLWGLALGLALNVLAVPLPAFILKFLDMFGALVVPLMIFSIGLTLTLPKVSHAYIIAPAVVTKLVLAPCISFIAAGVLGLKDTALASSLMEGAMPTMVVSLLVAARFKLDTILSAFIIVATTLLSFITLPVAAHLANMLAF